MIVAEAQDLWARPGLAPSLEHPPLEPRLLARINPFSLALWLAWWLALWLAWSLESQ